MTKKEIGKLLTIAAANFPGMSQRDLGPTAMLWEKMLSDMDYELAEAALIKVLSTAKYFPTVGEIREAAAQLSQPAVLTAAEAWGEVMTALRKYGLYNWDDAERWMTPSVAKMVKRFGWWELCHAENIDVIRGQFMRAWEQHAKGEKERAALPQPIRQMIDQAAQGKALPGGKSIEEQKAEMRKLQVLEGGRGQCH